MICPSKRGVDERSDHPGGFRGDVKLPPGTLNILHARQGTLLARVRGLGFLRRSKHSVTHHAARGIVLHLRSASSSQSPTTFVYGYLFDAPACGPHSDGGLARRDNELTDRNSPGTGKKVGRKITTVVAGT